MPHLVGIFCLSLASLVLGALVGLAICSMMGWGPPVGPQSNLLISHIDREGRMISRAEAQFPTSQACDAARAKAMGLYELASANGYRNGMKARCTP